MTKCQHCGKELSEAEVVSNYCFGCGNPAGIQAPKPEPEPEPKLLPEELELKELTDESIRCPHCNFLNPKNAKICDECGGSLGEELVEVKKVPKKSEDTEAKKCPNCDKEVKEHWKICPCCGKSLVMEEMEKEVAEEINRCPSCGKEVESDWLSCPYCEKPLIKKIKEEVKEEVINKCPNCGKKVEKEWSVCPFCQTPIGPEVEEEIVKAKLIFPDKSEKEITEDELIIGREDFEECQRKDIITKEQLSYISRRSKPHFKILNRNNEFYILDENSANGTWVNETLIEKKKEHELHDNDEIILSDEKETKIQFKIIRQ